MRRLELSDGKSHKFWQIESDGCDLKLQWGRIGTKGQSKIKTLDSPAAAGAEAEKQIRSKIKKGYVEVAAAASGSSRKAEGQGCEESLEGGEGGFRRPDGDSGDLDPGGLDPGGLDSGDLDPGDFDPSLEPSKISNPDEESIDWPPEILQRVHPRRDLPLPAEGPKVTVRAAYRALRKAWPDRLQNRAYLDEAAQDHLRSLIRELKGDLPKETPLPADSERQSVGLLALRLRSPVEVNTHRDVASRHLVDYWVQGAGLGFAMEAAARVLREDHQATPRIVRQWRGRRAGAIRWGAGGFDRLRQYLAAANEDEYTQAMELASAVRPELGQDQKVLLSYLFPERSDWLEECLEGGVPDVLYVRLLLLTVRDVESLAQIPAEPFLLSYQGEKENDVLPTLAYALGALAGPFFEEWLGALCESPWRASRSIQEMAALTALLPHENAHLALTLGLEDPDVFEALREAVERFPLPMTRLLATELGKRGQRAQRSEVLIKGALARSPQIPGLVGGEVGDRLAALASSITSREPARREDLPEVLRDPPWLRRPKRAAAKSAVLVAASEPHRMDWAPGERERFSRHRPLDEYFVDSREVRSLLKMGSEKAIARIMKLKDWDRTEIVHNLPQLLAVHELALLRFMLGLSAQLIPRVATSILPIDSVQLALPVAQWFQRSQVARPRARRWLLARAETAALGLLPVAVGKKEAGKKAKDRQAAIEALRMIVHNGRLSAVDGAIAYYSRQVPATELRAALAPVLEVEPLFVLPAKMPQLPPFADPLTLPRPTLRDGRLLPEGAVRSLLLVLAFSSPTDPYAGLRQVKDACDPRTLASFSEALFDAWLMSGADAKEKWAFFAVGHLGGDGAARRLEPLIREWPKKSAYPRALMGLEVLGMIGTDMALMLLDGIAQKASKGLQRAAQEAIERIAAEEGFTAEQLADRLVPDLGLSSDGTMTLDYGPRHFIVGFDEQLKPFVVDGAGKKRKTAPKPGAKDDSVVAAPAYEAWKELKKDARKIAKGQIGRLESAMCAERRWPGGDFETLVARHPLLVHLVRRLLWGAFDSEGELLAAFRVDADGSYADIEDEPFELPAQATVGLLHRLDLEAAVIASWRELWGDYELVSPFPQLDRDIYRPTEAESQALELRRFDGTEVPGGRILGLERQGWRKGEVVDNGLYWWMARPFDGGRHEVLIYFEPGIAIGDPNALEPPTLKEVVVMKNGSSKSKPVMPFGQLPPKVFSEVMRDLEELRRPR